MPVRGEFLHLPDPGSVGPFMVNLVAQCRTISKFPGSTSAGGRSRVPAVNMYLRISPAIPGGGIMGYEGLVETRDRDSFIPLKHLLWDSPRHVVVDSGDTLQFGLYKKDINDRFIRVDCEVSSEPMEDKGLVTWHYLRQMVVKNIMSNFTCEIWRNEPKVSLEGVIELMNNSEFMQIPQGEGMKNTLINELLLVCPMMENIGGGVGITCVP